MSGPVSLDELQSPYVRGLVYGGAGVGKTVFCCGSQYLRTLHLDVDDGALSARNWQGDPAQGLGPTRRDLVKTWAVKVRKDLDDALRWLLAHPREYDLVVLDTATELQRVLLAEVMQKANHVVADTRDWGICLSAMEEYGRQFRHLPFHTLWACHEQFYNDEKLRRNVWRPNFRGQFATEYAKHFSFIARYTLIEQQVALTGDQVEWRTQRVLNCERDATTDAKHRGGLSKWEWPNLDEILRKLTLANQVGANEQNLAVAVAAA